MSALCLLPDFSLLQTVKEIKCELPHLRNPEHDADDMNQDRPHVAKIYPRECRINTDRASDETANHNQDLHDPLCCFSQQAFRKDPCRC